MATYEPTQQIVDNYANLLVNFALGGGKGIKPGEYVRCQTSEWSRPMYGALQKAVILAGGIPINEYRPVGFERELLELATPEQLEKIFPYPFYAGLVEVMSHRVQVLPFEGIHDLEGLDEKMSVIGRAFGPIKRLLVDKENRGEFSWCVAMWGHPEYAAEVGLSIEEYWQQIILGCNLDYDDPVARWKEVGSEIDRVREQLNSLAIDRLHVEGPTVDLWITLGEQRRWQGGGGRNIPSYEVFTSPDWRGTEGWVEFDQPLYYYGSKVTGVKLVFKGGVVTEAYADENFATIKEMLTVENANRIGEFSLTDNRLSRISKPMADTLYDENIGGNMHLAIGASYPDTLVGDPAAMSPEDWNRLGFNDPNCEVHTDLVTLGDRVVTAHLKDGSQRIIYEHGQFAV